MNKINIGDYVKFKNGKILKVNFVLPDGSFTFYGGRDVIATLKSIKSICAKISSNKMDLIEVGDIIRGKDNHLFEVYAVGSDCVYINNLEEFILIKDIKGIVTKEQFSQMEYRIGD